MRKKTRVKAKSKKPAVNRQTALVKKVEQYTQLSLKGDVVGYFGSPLFAEDINSLKPKDRLVIYTRLLEYVFPKLQATAVDFASNDPSTKEGANRLMELSKRFSNINMKTGKPDYITQNVGYAELVE